MDAIGVSYSNPLEDYEMIHRIGSGTYGDVFKARNIKTSVISAIKVVKLDPGDDILSIQQEITMIKECTHKNIVAYFGSYLRNNKLWICMEYCGGGSLQDIYHVTGPLNERQIAYVCRETLQVNALKNRSTKILFFQLSHGIFFSPADFGVAAEINASVAKRKSFIGTPYWMAPEVAAVEKKGGYNQLCDIWAVGITAIELAELQPPMFDLHPMRALMMMSKSSFQPPKLKDKTLPTLSISLQHPFVSQLLTRTLAIELLDMASNPVLQTTHTMDESDLDTCSAFPDQIHSLAKHLPVQRTQSEEHFDLLKFGPPMRKETELSPDLGSYDEWSITGDEKNSPSLLECVEEALLESLKPIILRRYAALMGLCVPAEGSESKGLWPGETSYMALGPPLSPEWSTLRRRTEDSRGDCHGLPPTPKVHMGACFSKVFNGCPLKIHCAVTWVLPKTKDQHLILGTEEGIYTLNLNELHEDTMEKLLPQRCSWLYVMNNVLMSISGKSSQLCSQRLTTLFDRRHLQKRQGHLYINAHRLTERINSRKFSVSGKISDTKGCRRCSVVHNPYTDSTFLCAVVPTGLVLLLWYEPLQKFMQLKYIAVSLPETLPIFELLVLETDELPQVCVGVSRLQTPVKTCERVHFDIIHLNDTPRAQQTPVDRSMKVMQVTQLDRDTVLIGLENTVNIVNLDGSPSKGMTSTLTFDFSIETLVCLQDSVLAFWKHGLKGRSLHSDEVTQEITDESRIFRVLGTSRDIILQSTPTDNPSALSNLYILTGHESSY
uniref:Mitogen-activated protein kinase kinase kinase kinase n=1 Tax=Oncorhynchus mykiss TaxID=8022 RepID=A0A8C7UQ88_ONCMY